MQWEFLHELNDTIASGSGSIRKRIFRSLQKLIATRKALPALAGQQMELIATGNKHLLSFIRINESYRLIVIANFTDQPQSVDGNRLRTVGLGRFFKDALTDREFGTSDDIVVDAYETLWLMRV